jgi:hypothetical protein
MKGSLGLLQLQIPGNFNLNRPPLEFVQGQGGAIYAVRSSMKVNQTAFVNNAAPMGGAISSGEGSLVLLSFHREEFPYSTGRSLQKTVMTEGTAWLQSSVHSCPFSPRLLSRPLPGCSDDGTNGCFMVISKSNFTGNVALVNQSSSSTSFIAGGGGLFVRYLTR